MAASKQRKKPPSLTRAETQERLSRIVTMRVVYQMTFPQIAAELDMTERAAKHAFAEWRKGNRETLVGEDAIEVVERMLMQFRDSRQRLLTATEAGLQAEVCRECQKPCGHASRPGIVVGSTRGLTDISEKEILLRQLVGLLPRDLGDARHTIRGRMLMQLVFDAAEEVLPAGQAEKLVKAIHGRLEGVAPAALPAGELVED